MMKDDRHNHHFSGEHIYSPDHYLADRVAGRRTPLDPYPPRVSAHFWLGIAIGMIAMVPLWAVVFLVVDWALGP